MPVHCFVTELGQIVKFNMKIFLGLCFFVLVIGSGLSDSGAIEGTLSEIDRLMNVNKRAERGRCESSCRAK